MQRNNNIIKSLGLQDLPKKYKVSFLGYDKKLNKVVINIRTSRTSVRCPKCGKVINTYKDHKHKIIKHLDICNNKSIIEFSYARYYCKECNTSVIEDISDLVEKYYRYSNSVINSLLDKMSICRDSIKAIAQRENVSCRLVNRLFFKNVYIKKINDITWLPQNIGMDEFKGNMKVLVEDSNGVIKRVKSKYQVQITDLDTGKVIALLPFKETKTIKAFLDTITNKSEVRNVVIDFCMQFKRQLNEAFKNAKISSEYFHLTKLVTTAVDNNRLDIWRKITKDKDKKEERKYLKSLKHCILTDINRENLDKNKKDKIISRLNKAFEYAPELKEAYNKLQEFYNIKRYSTNDERYQKFKEWFNSIDIKQMPEFKSLRRTVRSWYKYIKNMFYSNLSNGKTEGNNNSIKVLKRNSYGFCNFENAKNRILSCI